ncbi:MULTISPECIES: ANR family transcriptional regulator [unclassified Pantoea]|uniref:ANR family transcriptional regulator n=1 Tax=unclassified Pantoea TaxID=2630326 RepID=UPI0005345D9B|nr:MULTISPECIES: ANR family transcriptional regulator [unclassified Pantoea]MDU6387253.1 ANR family transcriptional regulator [Pantoea sp.]
MKSPAYAQRVSQYSLIASDAARVERDGNYALAAKMWKKAAGCACRAVNQNWAEKRAGFCQTKDERFLAVASGRDETSRAKEDGDERHP